MPILIGKDLGDIRPTHEVKQSDVETVRALTSAERLCPATMREVVAAGLARPVNPDEQPDEYAGV